MFNASLRALFGPYLITFIYSKFEMFPPLASEFFMKYNNYRAASSTKMTKKIYYHSCYLQEIC